MRRTGTGAAGAGPDAAQDRRRRGAVRNRFHHLAFHRRHRDHGSGTARPGTRRRTRSHPCLAFLLGWAIFRVTDWISPPEPVGLKLIRPVDPERDHIQRQSRRPADPGGVRGLRVPVLQPRHGVHRRGARPFRRRRVRYVWRHLPLERVHPRAFDAARAAEAAGLQGKYFEMGSQLFAHQDDLEWSDIYRYANSSAGPRPFRRGRAGAFVEGAAPGAGRRAGRRVDGSQLDADVFRQRHAAQGPVGFGQPDPRAGSSAEPRTSAAGSSPAPAWRPCAACTTR